MTATKKEEFKIDGEHMKNCACRNPTDKLLEQMKKRGIA